MDTAKTDWIYGIWFVEGPEQDFFGTMFKAEGKWIFDFRFRYYDPTSTNPHDGKDRKQHHTFATNDDTDAEKARMLAAIGQTIIVTEAMYQNKADFVDLDCAQENPKVLFELGSRPWAHIKLNPPEPAKGV